MTTRAVQTRPSVPEVVRAVANRSDPVVLDSSRADVTGGRYTIVACDPVDVFDTNVHSGDPFENMRQRLADTGLLKPAADPPGLPCPFPGGWIGYFGYEAGRYVERLPATTNQVIGLPLARFALYDSAAVLDHWTGRWTLAAADFRQSGSCQGRLDTWAALLESAAGSAMGETPRKARHCPSMSVGHNLTRERFMAMVERAREYISAGDIFQVNLARRETVAATEPAVDLYLRLREANPGAYSAFLAWDGGARAVLSSSPELFLDAVGRKVVTRPIKGTRPRLRDPAGDDAMRQELAVSPKDRAELAMIVDLERNDLGRVCEYGSIRVSGGERPAAPYAIETHATVHHLVATVEGRFACGQDLIDLLRASFPGGSITGAPKVRAMEIIDELEPDERSVYTGAIGYFAPGRMTMNIAIRTIIQADGMLHWYAGGGIVADSVPALEYEETCAKALGMRRAVQGNVECGMLNVE